MQLANQITQHHHHQPCPTTATETVPQTGMSAALPAAAIRHRSPTHSPVTTDSDFVTTWI